MISTSCFVQLAATVVTLSRPNSFVNITSSLSSQVISSMELRFKSSQSNTRIAGTSSQRFAIVVQDGLLSIEYNMSDAGVGSIHLGRGLLNNSSWYLLNITSQHNLTYISLHKCETSLLASCLLEFSAVQNVTLLGDNFTALFNASGFQIGGRTHQSTLQSFNGCIGGVSVAGHHLELLNMSCDQAPFHLSNSGVSKGCPCRNNPCVGGIFLWDKHKGRCDCKCKSGYHGELCANKMMTDDDDDEKLVYIVVGITVGILLLVLFVVCLVLYMKRTSSSAFGVYNPKSQEQMQGQPMKTAFTVPVPEKLI